MSAFPSNLLKMQTCNITSETLTEVTTYGLNTSVAKRGNPHRWSIQMVTPPLGEIKARELTAFLDSLDGRYETFTLPCPLKFMGTVSTFKASGVEGTDEINVYDMPDNIPNAVVAGDFIKFSNHDKVYKVMKTLDSNEHGTTNGVFTIYPKLFAQLPAGTVVSPAVFSCRLLQDNVSLPLDARKGLYPVMIRCVENV